MSTARPHTAHRSTAAAWLPPPEDGLRATLAAWFSQVSCSPRSVDVETRPSPYASSFAIEEAVVRFDDDRVLALVCKDSGEAAMLPEARRIKPRFLYDPLREIATYERILGPLQVGAPRFYGSAIDEHRGRYWLFLERVRGVPLTEVGDFAVWQHASRWLASMHGRIARHPGLPSAAAAVPLIQYDRALARLWMVRALQSLDADAGQPSPQVLRFASLAPQYEAVLDEVAGLPAGFVHGEFFASNVLVETAAGRPRVRPVDWEAAGMGPLLMDLAALTAGRWTEGERAELATSYHAAFSEAGGTPLSKDDFMRALECCRLQLAVQQLGWAREWTPPPTHVQDWLGEALHAAERLGL
jgi:aminoglycoside phosphotransferase (APT) family kinase protein